MTHLDNFRYVYTINQKNEKFSDGDKVAKGENMGKMLMWIPIVSHVMSVTLLIGVFSKEEKKDPTSLKVAKISRCAIGIVFCPLLIAIDLVGTAVKCCIDAKIKHDAAKQSTLNKIKNAFKK